MKKQLWAMLVFPLIAAGICFAQSEPQSLAELAKQNKQDKKADKKAVLVLTEDDLRSSSVASAHGVVSVVGDASAIPAEPPAANSSQKKASDKDQTASSKDTSQVAELKKNLDSYKEEQEGWKRSAKRYEEMLGTETSDFQRETYQSALANDRTNAALCQQKIDQVQADLAKAQQASGAIGADRQPSKPAVSGNQP